jgi:hypothetical protein
MQPAGHWKTAPGVARPQNRSGKKSFGSGMTPFARMHIFTFSIVRSYIESM